jgi:hypothetical protein
MSEKPTKVVVNCTTGVQEILELTDEEIAQLETDKAIAQIERDEREASELAKAEAKASAQAKLAALGLTEEEIAAL